MTTNVMKEEVNDVTDTGMNDFIGKPFDIEDLLPKSKTAGKPNKQALKRTRCL